MKIIFLRHAHRDTANRLLNNGLSEKGLRQCKRLHEYWREQEELGSSKIFQAFTSPKLRCIETIYEVIPKDLKAQVDTRLDEQLPTETGRDFEKRIESFLDDMVYGGEGTVLVCSHGDWIPEAVRILTQASIVIKKCGFCVVERQGRSWVISQLFRV